MEHPKIFFVGLLLILSSFGFGESTIDSIQNVLKTEVHDTVRVEFLLELSDEYEDEGMFEEGISAAAEALAISEKLIQKNTCIKFARVSRIKAHKWMGINLESTDRYSDAQTHYLMALDFSIAANEKSLQCGILGNLGLYYYNLGDYPLALDYSLKQLDLAKEIGDKSRIASAYNKIGITYKRQMLHKSALENLFKSVEVYEELNDIDARANVYNNIGNVYYNMDAFDEAYTYYMLELEAGVLLDDMVLIADAYNCTAQIFNKVSSYPADSIANLLYEGKELNASVSKMTMLDSAEHYFKKAIDAYNAMNSFYELADCYNGLGETYTLKTEHEKAISAFQFSYDLAKMNGILQKEMSASYGLFKNYKALKKYEASLQWYEVYNALNDSVFNASKSLEFGRLESKHEFDAQAAELLAKQEQEKALAEVERRKQRVILMVVSLGLGLVFLLLLFLFNRFRLIQKQKQTIEHHKAEVDQKQKEILDSITYAQRLQQAILTSPDIISDYFPEQFLLYKPKDIVAGDFYFFEATATHVFYAAADCTGHGVPGAMVSIVCSNALSRSIKEFGLSDPGEVLNKTRDLVVETFEKSGSDVKDGMDISLIVKNLNTDEIKWAGAHNPLWIIENETLTEIKGDKQPIGKYELSKPFTTKIVEASKNALLILLTDGYADQFGEKKGKNLNMLH